VLSERAFSQLKSVNAYQATLSRPVFFKARQPSVPLPPPSPSLPQIVEAPPSPPQPRPPAPLRHRRSRNSCSPVSISAGMRRAYLVPKGNLIEGIWVAEGSKRRTVSQSSSFCIAWLCAPSGSCPETQRMRFGNAWTKAPIGLMAAPHVLKQFR
jgi:hypothetical protein